ncbi:hypothetical protein [Absidia glauca]|uniref:Reverse transcriptase zinc-binding domain-containing protein n=1 Tax=Absidia glauca TaxID=4829 RepID=A0A168LN47_ABSGL|nr:hypothetical protein [Absidia glauca]
MPLLSESPLCPICLSQIEDAIHMMVSCPMKKETWKAGQAMLLKPIVNPLLIWQVITFQSLPRSNKELQASIPDLITYGRILQVIWSCHWQVVFDQATWSHANAMNRLRNSECYRKNVEGEEGRKEVQTTD